MLVCIYFQQADTKLCNNIKLQETFLDNNKIALFKLFHTYQNHIFIFEIFLQCCIQKHFSCSLIPTTFVSEVKMEFFTKESFLSFFLESSHITEHNETNTKDLDNSEQTKNSWIFFCLCVC